MALKITGKVNTEQIRTSIATPLLPHFDICVNLKSSSLQDHEQCLAEFVLQQSINSPAPAPNISHDDFANFIHAVSKIRVTIPSHCTEYIQSYFVCTRKSLSSLASAGAFSSLVTIESLVRITIAHARLCLRDEAQLDDVLVAVMLVEESLVFASGVSVLGFISLPEDQENIWKLCSNDFVKSEWDEVDGGKTSTEDQAMLRLYVELEKAIST
ncbi:hypothetical protein BC830DRAFT_607524 [Chytriomyces sp. MP71]|nr:hypothetical protein BC830DRAFT_607524 [Chytriomyces sp. MP71]